MRPIANTLLMRDCSEDAALDGRDIALAAHRVLYWIRFAHGAAPCTRRSTSGATVPESKRAPPPAKP